MSLLMYQRLEPTGEYGGSVRNMGGVFIRLQHIEAAVPVDKTIMYGHGSKSKYKECSVTEIHMLSGTKHLVIQSISEVLKDINVPI